MPELKEIQEAIKETLAKDLGKGLELLRKYLKNDSDENDNYILLMSRYNSVQTEIQKGMLSSDNAQVRLNRIRNSFIHIIKTLQKSDVHLSLELEEAIPVEKDTIPEKEVKKDEPNPLKLFISYSHEDESYKDALKDELIVLERVGDIVIWNDREMTAGTNFDKTIKQNLLNADIICLLVSKAFVKSDYCYITELDIALEREKRGEIKIAPILVKRTPNFNRLPFSHLITLPKDATPIEEWDNADNAWANVSEEITKLVEKLKKSKA